MTKTTSLATEKILDNQRITVQKEKEIDQTVRSLIQNAVIVQKRIFKSNLMALCSVKHPKDERICLHSIRKLRAKMIFGQS